MLVRQELSGIHARQNKSLDRSARSCYQAGLENMPDDENGNDDKSVQDLSEPAGLAGLMGRMSQGYPLK